jgi:putative Mg2+ transporter-C (MgtC) family protein
MTDSQLVSFLLPKIIVATICGLIIGWEREVKNKVAGIRTHIIVCVGACLFTSTGFILGSEYHVDPTRVIGQIITGIGFLGGGVIFKHDDKVSGITSAAFIWLIAAMGVLVGIGYLFSTLLFTIGLLVVLILLQKLEDKIKKNNDGKQN